jgi:hypothetical protein
MREEGHVCGQRIYYGLDFRRFEGGIETGYSDREGGADVTGGE